MILLILYIFYVLATKADNSLITTCAFYCCLVLFLRETNLFNNVVPCIIK